MSETHILRLSDARRADAGERVTALCGAHARFRPPTVPADHDRRGSRPVEVCRECLRIVDGRRAAATSVSLPARS